MNSAIVHAVSSLLPIKLKFALEPSAKPKPPNKIDLPAPVSPVKTFKPLYISISISSIRTIFLI